MNFDIIDVTEEEINSYTAVQMQLLRTAQKSKNELLHKMEKEFELFKRLVYTDDMKVSSLLEQKRAELREEYEYELDIIIDQLLYGIKLGEPVLPDPPKGSENAGYVVDYSLSYPDRYNAVKEYYMSIADPAERMALYDADQVAKDYLSSYYRTLYNVLYTYSK